MGYHVEARTINEQPTAIVQATMPSGSVANWLGDAYQTVFDYLERVGTPPAGPPFARYSMHDDTFDMEAGVPVVTAIAGAGRIKASTLPSGPAAVTVHRGRYEDLDAAYDALVTWVRGHGFQPVGPHWENYLSDPTTDPDPDTWQTEVVLPYRQ